MNITTHLHFKVDYYPSIQHMRNTIAKPVGASHISSKTTWSLGPSQNRLTKIKTAKLSDFEGFPMFSPEIKDILVLVGSQDFRPTEAIRSHF
jgi:hypothetical protein